MAKKVHRSSPKSETLFIKNISISHLDSCHPSGPSDRSRHAACLCKEVVYIHGGKSGFRTLSDFWQYNSRTSTWEICNFALTNPKPGLLAEHFMIEYNTSVYLVGHGFSPVNRNEMQVWQYSIAENLWRRCMPPQSMEIPPGRQFAKGAIIEPKLYIFGGVVELSLTPTNDLLEFDLDTNYWKTVKIADNSETPVAIYDHSCISFRRYLYVFGGIVNRRPQSTLRQFDSHSSTWKHYEYKTNGPAARYGHAATLAGNSMFIHGGRGQREEDLHDLWQLDLNCTIWTEILLSDPVPLSHHTLLWIALKSSDNIGPTILTPFEEGQSRAAKSSSSCDRTISQEHLIIQDHESNSILRRLSSRRKKSAFVNDAIELSDFTKAPEVKWVKSLTRDTINTDIALKDLSNFPSRSLNLLGSGTFLSEFPVQMRGQLLIIGGENGETRKTLRIQEIQVPLNMQI